MGVFIDPELARKAKLLRDSKLFVNPSEGAEMIEKWMIFLALAGQKPVSEACSGRWVQVSSTRRVTVPDDPAEVKSFLESLGLACEVTPEENTVVVAVSLKPELLKEYQDNQDVRVHGRLFGLPETAVAAMADGNCLPIDEQDGYVREAGFGDLDVQFRLSRDHWREELETPKRWVALLKAYDLYESK